MAKVEFRTGAREIPDYLADLMASMDTTTMTYDEAVAAVNRLLERRVIDNATDALEKAHFAGGDPRRSML